MKILATWCLPLILLGCVTPPAPAPTIQSVAFVSTTGAVAPSYWHDWTLTVNNRLQTKYVTKSIHGGTLLETKMGTITQAQFDGLVRALHDADFTRVKSTELNLPPIAGNETLTVQTDKGVFEFKGPSTAVFPPAIGAVFGMRAQYMP